MRVLLCEAFGPPERLVIAERPEPEPGPGQVRVRVHAAGINYPDLLMISGQYQVRTPPPFVPGYEAAGVVEAIGEAVTRFAPGDRVIAKPGGGAFADKCLADEALCTPLPEVMSFEQGAGFTVAYATSYHALRQGTELRAGETLLVLGAAGGVGITAVEIGHALGARVIAAASSAEKLDFARAAGADETIDYRRTPLREALRELRGGEGVDVVYDPVGGEYAEAAYRALAWQGRYLVVGFASGAIPSLPLNIALLKEARIIGVWWGTWAELNPARAQSNFEELTAMVEAGRLTPRVTRSFPLEHYVEAFRTLAERRALGKMVFRLA